MIYRIASKSNDKIKKLVKLYDSKYRKETALFLVEGYHMLEMALKANAVQSVFTTKEIKDLDKNIDQYIVYDDVMAKISKNKSSQGVIAVCKMKQNSGVYGDKVLYLDNVSDPGNVGTILRSALAFGYKDVLLSSGSCSIYNEKVLQSTQGAIFELNIVEGVDDLKSLKNEGYRLIATALRNSINLSEVPSIDKKFVLILGNEAHGVSDKILDLADIAVRIEINNMESLNVGVAGGIAMYELNKIYGE